MHKHGKYNEDFDNIGPFEVTEADLPLSCPMPDMTVWNAHPRVYLPIAETGKVTCPYCSAHYILKGFTVEISKNIAKQIAKEMAKREESLD